ncbi:MAG: YbjN domain-containing protein [Pseudomonadota bacterium]
MGFRRFQWVSAVLVAAALFSTASAQRLSNQTGLVPDFHPSKLQPLMNELGARTEILSLAGRPTVGAIMPSGARFLMTPTACDDTAPRCRGVSIQALFSSDGANAAVINRFNQQGTIPKAVLLGERVVVFHYLIADYGMPRGNFDVNIGVMEFAIGRFAQFRNDSFSDVSRSVSLGYETHHVGTTSLRRPEHPNGFVVLNNPPKEYFN